MQKITLMSEKIKILKSDFRGIFFDFNGFMHFIILSVISVSLFFLIYLVGRKIRPFFLNDQKKSPILEVFLNLAIGYIFFSTGISILGIFSLLTPFFIWCYFLISFLFCLYPFTFKLHVLKKIVSLKKIITQYSKKDVSLAFVVMVLIFITFLRLISPEVGADALDYHTSYPRLYIKNHSMMLPPIGTEGFITVPQLGEMPYVITEFFGMREASRFLHFLFYLCVMMVLCYYGFTKSKFKYAPLIFATSPIVLHIAPSGYGDLPVTFLFLLTSHLLIFEKTFNRKVIILSGVLFGGMLASKVWALAYIPIFVVYILVKGLSEKKHILFKYVLFFLFVSFFVSMVWYIRSYLLTGNPLYYNNQILTSTIERVNRNYFSDIRVSLLNFPSKFNMWLFIDYSPLFIISLIPLLIRLIKKTRKISFSDYGLFAFIASTIFIVFPAYLFDPRYLLPLYCLFCLGLSSGLNELINSHYICKYIFYVVLTLIVGYYSINSIILALYGFGWESTDNYLTRYHTSITASYYNFDHKFSKLINKKETVATYGIAMYYYADFNYKHVFYIFRDKKSLKQLKQNNISKLLIRGGDIDWFCNKLHIECKNETIKELASYKPANQYLYEIIKK